MVTPKCLIGENLAFPSPVGWDEDEQERTPWRKAVQLSHSSGLHRDLAYTIDVYGVCM